MALHGWNARRANAYVDVFLMALAVAGGLLELARWLAGAVADLHTEGWAALFLAASASLRLDRLH